MESKKFNWNNILTSLIAMVSIVMASLFIGICFFVPVSTTKANALTKKDILDAGIYFNSAKTNIRTATNYNKVKLTGITNDSEYSFYSYLYDYNDVTDTQLYYSLQGANKIDNFSSEDFGNIQASINNKNLTVYDKYTENRTNEFIPYGVTHFTNETSGAIEKVFYDEIDNNDFVLLNNFNNHNNDSDFNVENFYLSFGTPYIDELHTTPLHQLRVEGKLYSNEDNKVHNLVLNPVRQTSLLASIGDDKKSLYWYQYFDLRNLSAYKSSDADSGTYSIQNQQGKYEITFHFIRYVIDNNKFEPASLNEETFTYTFYLLDSTNYSNIPTLHNAELGSINANATNEYFYNFNNDNPFINYAPDKFNISYLRENRDIIETISSNYALGTYTLNSKYFPKGVITYKSGDTTEKEVYILNYYNEDKNIMSYLYLANNNGNQILNNPRYQDFMEMLDDNILEFEYKITQVLNIGTDGTKTTYTTTTYTTNNYSYANFDIEKAEDLTPAILKTSLDTNYECVEETCYAIDTDSKYYQKQTDNTYTHIATITNSMVENITIDDLKAGILINKNTLSYSVSNNDDEITLDNFIYKLEVNDDTQETILKKKHTLGNTDEDDHYIIIENEIIIENSTNGNYEIIDPIDKYISFTYNATNKEISNFNLSRNIYETSNLNTNLYVLDKLLYIDEIQTEIKYNLSFNELGIHNLDYKYNTLVYKDNNVFETVTNGFTYKEANKNVTTNILKLVDYNQDFVVSRTENVVQSTVQDLKVTLWGYLDQSYNVTLANRSFHYDELNHVLKETTANSTRNYNLTNNSYKEATNSVINFGDMSVPAEYIISVENDGIILKIVYTIGTIQTTTNEICSTAKKADKNYISNITTETIQKYTLNNEIESSEKITSAKLDGTWGKVGKLVKLFEGFESLTNGLVFNTFSTSSSNISQDKLHIFGSISYFNKENKKTDSEYAKFEQVNNKLNTNYISDVTKFAQKLGYSKTLTGTEANDKNTFKDFAKNMADEKLLNVNDIIITDVTPVFWKNFSTLLYSNKISKSYIFRYTNYTIDKVNNTIDYGSSCETSTYNKDIYCQFDGLYEIVVLYKYDNIKSLNASVNKENTIFYQLFTFIIDNSSPELEIKVQDDDGNYTQDLGLNKYTNKNIQLSWEVPTYFKNDIYIDIAKTSYDTTKTNGTEKEFSATYRKNTITVNSGSSEYVNQITSYDPYDYSATKYYVYITSTNLVASNGNYKITLHYSSRGASTVTDEFIIDKLNIDGTQTLPAIQNDDGSYSTNVEDLNYVKGNQIINYDFTFRYNKKSSGAKISAYWYKIDLIKAEASEYDKSISVNTDETAITTTYKINGKNLEDIEYGNQYLYDTNTDIADTRINNANYFSSTNSCIYLFKLKDEAGNECRYVVFYDTTTPRFLTEPTSNNSNNIVNDTTMITWGDYKAILIDTNDDYEIIYNGEGIRLDNYNQDYDKTVINDKFKESLIYINSSDKFNDTKIQLIDENYYLLLPLEEVTIKDTTNMSTADHKTSLSLNANNNMPSSYYFFPKDPITVDKTDVNIKYFNKPIIEDNTLKGTQLIAIDNVVYTQVKNSHLQIIDKFVKVTASNPDQTYYGAFGEGEYIYQVYDKQRNFSSGYLWMNLDITLSYAYGIFDSNIDDLSQAVALTGNEGSYSTAKLYMSSLAPSENVPDYELTYKFHELNDEYYETLNKDYKIESVRILTSADSSSNFVIKEKQTYLELIYSPLVDGKEDRIVHIELTNEIGDYCPQYSYPYDLAGTPGLPDNNGKAQHVYKNNILKTVEEGNNQNRIFSTIINPTNDSTGRNIVTQEGLYIFKRTYTNLDLTKNEDLEKLGEDKLIIYRIYYVDRTGIINVTTLNDIAKKLYDNQGEDFGFILGSDYKNTSQKKFVNSDTIQNNEVPNNSNATTSNSYNKADKLFTTNKIQVQFNLTTDKYNFNAFYNKFYQNILNVTKTGEENLTDSVIEETLNKFLFNRDHFEHNIYKINLTLKKGEVQLIDESKADDKQIFNDNAIANYLINSAYDKASARRYNSFNFYKEDNNSNAYKIYLLDNSGCNQYDDYGTLINSNYLPNRLDISFLINHKAPTGDMYGKYYGRHNYDEDQSSSHSIPLEELDENNVTTIQYALLSKYLKEGQLQHLSLNYKDSYMNGLNGQYVKLYSTNNETLVFTFAITQDDYMAQIDPNNIKIYQNNIDENSIIFNRTAGTIIGSPLVTESRMSRSFFKNVIDGITYYAIVVFDNNLDKILNDNEKDYSNFRLLDANKNPDSATYYLQINYVGDSDNYIKEDNLGNQISYHATTYEVEIDRNKPIYNLTKLMSLDKYVYENVSTELSTTNYKSVYESYKPYYHFKNDTAFDFERSDLENYFFALDYRENSSFVFESIDDLDSNSNGGIYIRPIDVRNYKFSITPDDYKSYYEATYLPGHPQFSPSRAETITAFFEGDGTGKIDNAITDKYYYITYGYFEEDDGFSTPRKIIDANDLVSKLLTPNKYYEIIECDEAGNYRVYAVYIPKYASTELSLSYEYKKNSSCEPDKEEIKYPSNTIIVKSGIDFRITNYITNDLFIKANITVKSTKLNELISIYYAPFEQSIKVINSSNLLLERITNVTTDDYRSVFIETINRYIKNYNNVITNKNSEYYTKYGYTIYCVVIDRLGFETNIENDRLYDYEFTFNVAGSILEPVFKNSTSTFTISIPAKTGTTYIKKVNAYIFKGDWNNKLDSDNLSNSFQKTASELMKGFTYTLSKGVYKFEIIDNFERINYYFYEFGSSSTNAGGNFKFNDTYKLNTDDYKYTATTADFVYDNTLYDIYIRFIGTIQDGESSITYSEDDAMPHIVYTSAMDYNEVDLKQYGISVYTTDEITTISFSGVTELTKYHIKTIPANISAEYGYSWNKEYSDTEHNLLVYDNKVAIYSAVPEIVVKNLNGNPLDTSEHLNLTEDFEVTYTWSKNYDILKQIDFDSKIVLTRTYTENNIVKTETLNNSKSYVITKPGDYTAYVVNSLNKRSEIVEFTRGEGQITMYAVYNVNALKKTDVNLYPSAKVSSEQYETEFESKNLIVFNYFTTLEYFAFRNQITNEKITIENLQQGTDIDTQNLIIDKTANQYLDVRVNSNLSISVQLTQIAYEGSTPFAKFRIYSQNKDTKEVYTYRFVKVFFLESTGYNLATTSVTTGVSTDKIYKGNNPVIKRPDNSLYVSFKFIDNENNTIKYVEGNTIYVDRYFNSELVETLSFSTITENTIASYIISQVGLHKFVIRDLADRTQTFGNEENSANSLQIYLINQIMFKVNNSEPINNQIFNENVNINIVSELSGLTLYNPRTLSISATKDGIEFPVSGTNELTFSEDGVYTVRMLATTVLSDESSDIADQQISTIYKFRILKTNIARNSFNVSKGTGFVIDKLVKIVNGEREEITQKYESKDSLLWLTHKEQGNSIFEVTLKYFNTTINDYQKFTFNVWINQDMPNIISSIANGTATKDIITLNYNPGIIYSQVGRCKILINGMIYENIGEDSERVVKTITLNEKGTYFVKIVSEDGNQISSYKYTKNEPMNQVTKIVIICVAIGLAVLVVLFFLIRKKGKYR